VIEEIYGIKDSGFVKEEAKDNSKKNNLAM